MTDFYNEIDKDAAAWLRELIAEGYIAPGIVDERSIEDVRPDELVGFTKCHFFAGIGIWPLALRAAGIPDDYPIWTGSCPCQPFSSAGKGDGFADERHLWPAWYHLIRQCRPTGILGEQVASKDAMPWIDLVHTDLEALGYAFGAIPFPTAGVGGPHIRDRLYWGGFSAGVTLGDTGSKGLQGHGRNGDHGHQPGWLNTITAGPASTAGEFGRLADLSGIGWREECPDAGGRAVGNGAQGFATRPLHGGSADGMGHTNSQRAGWDGRAVSSQITGQDRQHLSFDADASGGDGGLADNILQQRPDGQPGISFADAAGGRFKGATAVAGLRGDLRPGPVNGFWRASDWLHCRDGKWRPVEPGTQPLAYGMPRSMGDLSPELQRLAAVAGLSKASLKRAKQFRVGSLRGYGNAINAKAAQAFIESVMEAA